MEQLGVALKQVEEAVIRGVCKRWRQLSVSPSLSKGSNTSEHQNTPYRTRKLGVDTLKGMQAPCKVEMLRELSKLDRSYGKLKTASLPPIPSQPLHIQHLQGQMVWTTRGILLSSLIRSRRLQRKNSFVA